MAENGGTIVYGLELEDKSSAKVFASLDKRIEESAKKMKDLDPKVKIGSEKFKSQLDQMVKDLDKFESICAKANDKLRLGYKIDALSLHEAEKQVSSMRAFMEKQAGLAGDALGRMLTIPAARTGMMNDWLKLRFRTGLDIEPIEKTVKQIDSAQAKLAKRELLAEDEDAKQLQKSLEGLFNTYGKLIEMKARFENATNGKSLTEAEKQMSGMLAGYTERVSRAINNPADIKSILTSSFDFKTMQSMFDKVMGDRTASEKMVQNFESAKNQIDGYIAAMQKELASLGNVRPFDNIKFKDMTFEQKEAQKEFDTLKKKIEAQIEAWKNLKKSREDATDRLKVTTAIGQHNEILRAAQAYQQQAKEQAKVDQAAAKNAESYEVAKAKLDRYILSLERFEKQLTTAMSMPGVQANGALSNSLQAVLDRVAASKSNAQTMRGDSEMAMSRLLWANYLTEYRGVALAKNDIMKAATKEQSQYEKSQSRAAQEEKERIRQISVLTTKIQQLKEAEAQYFRKDYKYADSSAYAQAVRDVQKLMSELISLRTMQQGGSSPIGGAAFGAKIDEVTSKLHACTRAYKDCNAEERKAEQAERALARAHASSGTAINQNISYIRKLISEYERLSKASQKSSLSLNGLKDLFYQFAPVYGLQQAVMSIIEVGGEIEKQHIALQSIIGDLLNANELFGQIKNLALESPFKFGELNKDVKQLAAYNVETDQLYDTTKRLADISAGLGVSFERIALAYGQVKARSWLDGKELRQFAYAGVPLLQNLADMYSQTQGKTVTTSQVKKMVSNREVSFEDVQSVLWSMTDEGGKFFNMQSVLADTLLGRYNKLIDAWEIMLSGFAKSDNVIGSTMKTIIDWITKLVLSINTIAPALMAAFAPRILKSLLPTMAFAKGGIMSNLLSSKKSQVNALRTDIATGKVATGSLTPYQREMLATETKITNCEARRLAIANAIGKAELRQLYAKGQITRATYLQLANEGRLMKMYSMTGSIGMKAALGVKSLASGITGLFGGPGMMGISAVLVGVTYLYQKSEELKGMLKEMQDEMLQRYQKISDFLSSHNIWPVYDSGNSKEMLDMIKEYEDQLKEINPDRYEDIVTQGMNIDSLKERLLYLKQQLDIMKGANQIASGKIDVFTDTTKDDFEEAKDSAEKYGKALENINEYLDHLTEKDYKRIASDMREAGLSQQALALEEMVRSGYSRDEINGNLKRWAFANIGKLDFSDIGLSVFDKLRGTDNDMKDVVKSLADKISQAIPDIGKDPKVNEAYRQLREELESKLEMTPQQKSLVNIRLDDLLGLQESDEAGERLAEKVADMLQSAADESTRVIGMRMRYEGFNALQPAEKEVIRKLMESAATDLESEYPLWAGRLQQLLNDSTFYAHINLKLNDTGLNNLQKAIVPQMLNDGSGNKTKLSQYLEKWTKEGTLTEARKQAKTEVDALKAERDKLRDQAKKNSNLKVLADEAQANYEIALEAQKYVGIDPEKDKKNKSQADKLLDEWKNYLQMLKNFRSEYEKELKHWGKDKANSIVSSRKEFQPLFKALGVDKLNASDYVKNAELFEKVAQKVVGFTTEARRKWQTSVSKEKEEAHYAFEDTQMKAAIEMNKDSLSILLKEYDDYDKIISRYGKKTASQLAFSGGQPAIGLLDSLGNIGDLEVFEKYTRRQDALRKLIENEIDKKGDSSLTVEALKGKTKDALVDLFGDENTGSMVHEYIKDLKDAEQKIAQESLDKILALMDADKSFAAELNRIDAELEDTIQKINDNTKLSQNAKDRLISQANVDAATKKLQASPAYSNFFNRGWAVSNTALKGMASEIIENLEAQFKAGKITAEEYAKGIKEVNDALQKGKSSKKNWIEKVLTGLNERAKEQQEHGTDISAMAKQAQSLLDAGKTEDAQELFGQINNAANGQLEGMQATSETAQLADQIGQGMSEAGGEMASTVAIIDKIVHGINDTIQGLKEAYDEINALAQSYGNDSMEYSDAGGFLNSFSAASTQATNAWDSLKNGNAMGVVTGVIGSFTAPITEWNKHHDKKLQKQIDDIELQNKILSNGFSNMQRSLEKTMGGLYSSDQAGTYESMLDKYKEQLENSKAILQAEEDKKDSDESAIEDYKQQISDLEYNISNFAETMASELYGIDFKTWAGNLSDALVNAWASGTNAAEAYRQAVSDILKQTVTSVIQQKYIEQQLEPLMESFMKYFEDNGGVLDETGLGMLATMYQYAQSATDMAYDTLNSIEDYAQANGASLKSSSSSMSSSISGITEDTADLLLAYVNNIRLDVSANREKLALLVEEQVPSAVRSLGLIQSDIVRIQANTATSASFTEQIYDILNMLTNSTGMKKLSVAMN